jgi:hypothetical protein
MPDTTHVFQVGDPLEHRGIVVTPLFPTRNHAARYIALDDALPVGLHITEISEAGIVPELAVVNPLDDDVLLYDGEELVDAKQNRILDVSVLIGAQCTLPARQVSHRDRRRGNAEALATQPLVRGVAQNEAWAETGEKQMRMGVPPQRWADDDTVETFGRRLRELEQEFPAEPGQCGAVLAVGGDLCLDAVSRPDVFARLWPKLRAGYLLDALEHLDDDPAPIEEIAGFVDEVADAVPARGPSAGLGNDVRLRGPGVIGSALELDGELIQLSAFTSDGGGRRAFGRIPRPSRRR